MEKALYTYALTKGLYDKEGNYIDAYLPFVLSTIPKDNFVGNEEIQSQLANRYSIKIPLLVLSSMLFRAKKKGYVNLYKEKYELSSTGEKYHYILEAEIDVERKISSLLVNIVQFFANRGIKKQVEQIDDLIVGFINQNIEYLREWLIPISPDIENNLYQGAGITKRNSDDELLVEYIRTAEHEKPESYMIIRDMVLGSIISVVIQSENTYNMKDIQTREFRSCQVFLDTNYIFRLFGLNSPEFHEPAKELIELLRTNKLILKVFPFTIEEICKVLSGYPEGASRYPSTIKVDTLYSHLKRRGWQKSDVIEFIANIERSLSKEGIQIDWEKNISLESYTPPQTEWRGLITKYKPEQGQFYQNHDLAAIDMIMKIRGHPVRRIEDSKAFFLTSDLKLGRFNFIELGHKESSTVCEVLPDRLVANILWLKNPDSDIPLKSIIAAHSRDFLIDRRLWDRFNEVLKKLAQNGKISEQDISLLFYHSFIEDTLIGMDETNVDEITAEFVIEEIEKAAKLREQEVKALTKQFEVKESLFLEQLRKAEKEKDAEQQQYLEKIARIKNSIMSNAEKSASILGTLLSSFFTLLLIVVMYGLYWLSTDILKIGNFFSLLVSLFIGGGGLFGIWKKLRSSIKPYIFNKTYIKKLHDIELNDNL